MWLMTTISLILVTTSLTGIESIPVKHQGRDLIAFSKEDYKRLVIFKIERDALRIKARALSNKIDIHIYRYDLMDAERKRLRNIGIAKDLFVGLTICGLIAITVKAVVK